MDIRPYASIGFQHMGYCHILSMIWLTLLALEFKAWVDYVILLRHGFHFLALQFEAWMVIVILSETWFILWLPLVFKAWVDAVFYF